MLRPYCKIVNCYLLLFIFAGVRAQSSLKKNFRKISRPEKFWVLTHPFAAKKAFHLTQKVLLICDSLKKTRALDGTGNGDQLDAFRHSYWMALLTQHMSSSKAYKLGMAHEKGNKLEFKKNRSEDNAQPDSMSCVMDIFNDGYGIKTGLANKKKKIPASDHDLIGEIIGHITEGSLRILYKNKAGDFLDCSGKVIDLSLYKGKWNIPKCLIGSYAAPGQ